MMTLIGFVGKSETVCNEGTERVKARCKMIRGADRWIRRADSRKCG
jgi:hypothetical protein